MRRESWVTVPNALSLSRLLLAAAFPVVSAPSRRLALVALASASDWLDGWLARRGGIASRGGAILDPVTDRAFVLAAVSTFLFEGALTSGQYFVLLARDIMTAVGFLVARSVTWLRPVEFKARLLGKLVTTLQLGVLFALLLRPDLVAVLIFAVGIVSAAAIADYTLALWRARARTA